jgi:SSS family solute:Na+ symporter
VGALAFVLTMDRQNAINFQLLGGIWILQTLPAIVIGLYTRWLHRYALLAGWAVGMLYGTVIAYQQASPVTRHFGRSLDEVPFVGDLGYIAMTAFLLNLLTAVVLTFVFRAAKLGEGTDATSPSDYHADAGDPRIKPIPELTEDTKTGST